MKWPCMLGFKCPYLHYDEEGFEDLCSYPDLKPEEDTLYPYADEWFMCPLIDKGPLLDYLLDYDENNRAKEDDA